MICPKCGFEQPDGPECAQCGIIISRYRGAAFGAASPPAPGAPGDQAAAVFGGFEPAPGEVDRRIPSGSYAAPAPAGAGSGSFRNGAILAESFSTYWANLAPFLFISFVALSPRILFGVLAPIGLRAGAPGLLLCQLLDAIAALVGPQLAAGAVTYAVHEHIRGREATAGDSLRVGLSIFGRVFGVAFLSGLCVGVGFLLCIIPGVLLALRWAVAVPVAVEEQRGGTGALERSAALTAGCRREIFNILFVVGLVTIVPLIAVQLSLASRGIVAVNAGGIAVSLLTTGFAATASAVMYYRLRSVKESIDVQELASIFD